MHTRRRAYCTLGVLMTALILLADSFLNANLAVAKTSAPASPLAETSLPRATDTTDSTDTTEPLTATITALSSTVLSEKDSLTVSVDIANSSTTTATITAATLASSQDFFANDSELFAWFSGVIQASIPEKATLQQSLPLAVAPGAHATLTLSLKSDDRQWYTSAENWGARGVEVQVTANVNDAERSTSARTVLVAASTNTQLTRFPAAVAVVCTPSTNQLSSTPGPLEALLPLDQRHSSSGASLDTSTLALPSQPAWQTWDFTGVNFFWDSLGTASIARALSSDPLTATPATSQTAATADAGTVSTPAPAAAETSGTDTPSAVTPPEFARATAYSLTPYDADLAALAHANAADVGQSLSALAQQSAATSATDTDHSTAVHAAADFLPLTGSADADTLAFARTYHFGTPIVSADELEWDQSFYFPDARGIIHNADTSYPAIIANPTVSSVLSGTLPDPNSDEKIHLSVLNSDAVAVASSAIFYRQAPSHERSLVALTSVSCTDTSQSEETNERAKRIASLLSVPWLAPQSLSQLPTRSEPSEWTAAAGRTTNSGELTSSDIQHLTSFLRDAEALTHALPSHIDFAGGIATSAYQLLSTSWRSDPAARSQYAVTLNISAFLAQHVQIESSAHVNLIAEQTHIPIRVHSNLTVPLSVMSTLDIPDMRLSEATHAATSLKPDNTSTIQIPVQARGSGLMTVTAQLTYTDGQVFARSEPMNIRLHASWESTGTAIIGGCVLVIFVIGIINAARKGRRSQPVSDATFTEGLAAARYKPTE